MMMMMFITIFERNTDGGNTSMRARNLPACCGERMDAVSTLHDATSPIPRTHLSRRSWYTGLVFLSVVSAVGLFVRVARLTSTASLATSAGSALVCFCEEGYREGGDKTLGAPCHVSGCPQNMIWLFSEDNFTFELVKQNVTLSPWPLSLRDADLEHHLQSWTAAADRFWRLQLCNESCSTCRDDVEITGEIAGQEGFYATHQSTWIDASNLNDWVPQLQTSFEKSASRWKYRDIASAIKDWRLDEAARAFSDVNVGGAEAWPATAEFTDAIVHPDGVVESPVAVHVMGRQAAFTRKHTSRLFVLKQCRMPTRKELGLYTRRVSPKDRLAYLPRVATIANSIGGEYFHFVVETFVRVVPLLPELRESANVSNGTRPVGLVLHLTEMDLQKRYVTECMALLGISMAVTTTGALAAQTLLVPEPTPCGSASATQLHLLRRQLWRALLPSDHALLLYPAHYHSESPGDAREAGQGQVMQRLGGRRGRGLEHNHRGMQNGRGKCTILVVQRGLGGSLTRTLSNFNELSAMVEAEAAQYQCKFAQHRGDQPVWQQWQAFLQASAVVAVHGAGLANIVVMRPGGLVLEIMPTCPEVSVCS